MVKSCVPELDREGMQSANTTILQVLEQDDIQFATDYIVMSDMQMLRAFVRQVRQDYRGTVVQTYYVGITENPVRRLQMHADHHMPFINMMVVRVMHRSSDTAAWEKLAIQHLREHLGDHALMNRSEGGEGANGGIPHYGYILRCR